MVTTIGRACRNCGLSLTTMLLSPELADVAMVSISWVFLYLAFTCCVSATKLAPETQSKPPDSQLHWNLRVQGNMLEQSLPFLTALWMHALIVSPAAAAQLGWYVLYLRACYPVVWAFEARAGLMPPGFPEGPGSITVFCASMPQHAINIYLLAAAACRLKNIELKSYLFGYDALGCAAGYVAYFLAFALLSACQPAFRKCFPAVKARNA